ncbi:hypothetical protein BN1058_01689 [Paraliobacillus sp. PM-2]|uniref:hypothetical protein n=1 Tax=Paraliobacillus sp. PM-2 TaxID=1462524 RepID=UPI00061C3991|nr:hypothetical protein [Paraliobacillus sp. PM-2]CQR47378.1 hypothetical protein BN1058_01689 [Paraliobacillus sp. PM-2]
MLSLDLSFNQLRELMKSEEFKKDFYQKLKLYRENIQMNTFKKGKAVKDISKFGKYRIDVFCIIFCEVKEYAENLGINESVIRAQAARSLKGSNKTPVNNSDICILHTLSRNYSIGEIQELLLEFIRETNYIDTIKETKVYYNCVKEFIYRCNNEDWEF